MRLAPFAAILLLASGFASGADPTPEASPLEAKVFSSETTIDLPYRLLMPESIEPGKRYPLVVFLHGAGERGKDNGAQLRHGVPEFVRRRKEFPCVLIAPQCPEGQKWSDVDWAADRSALPDAPSKSMAATLALIADLKERLPIDPDRIYVTGLSMGGYGTWDLIARHPELVAAAVPVCGGGDEAQVTRFARLPLWAFHGARDPVVKPERSRRMIEALWKAGSHPGYTEYPDVAHDSWVPAYRDPALFGWLFAQKRKP